MLTLKCLLWDIYTLDFGAKQELKTQGVLGEVKN